MLSYVQIATKEQCRTRWEETVKPSLLFQFPITTPNVGYVPVDKDRTPIFSQQ